MAKYSGIFIVQRLRKKLKHYTAEKEPDFWMDTGSRELNSVLGHKRKGIPYGKIFEVSGRESHGKTGLVYELAGMAQGDGAAVALLDVENSFDKRWARIRGIDPDKIAVFKPYVGRFGTSREVRMSTAEDLCQELEAWIKQARKVYKKIFVGIDSIPALVPSAVADVEIDGMNMKTKLSLATFLSELLQRWVGYVYAYNVMLVFVNQVRSRPMVRFGSPEYTPGGNAVKFYCSVRVKVKRHKDGRMMNAHRQIGIKSTIRNLKNKAGGVENREIGYKLFFRKKSKFLPLEEIS